MRIVRVRNRGVLEKDDENGGVESLSGIWWGKVDT